MKIHNTGNGIVLQASECDKSNVNTMTKTFCGIRYEEKLTQRDRDLLFQVQAEGTWGWGWNEKQRTNYNAH